MYQSADIRKDNKRAIYRLMLDGKAYTKQQVSSGTGLSVATCNTLLNDMTAQGILIGGEKLSGEAGRSAVLYQIDGNHEQYLTVYFELDGETRLIETAVFSATGEVLTRRTDTCRRVSWEQLESLLGEFVETYPRIAQIIVGIPGIAEQGVVRHCDLPELENLPLQEKLEKAFSLPTAMENDMHHKAYGYYKAVGNREDVITLGYFQKHMLPGTATLYKGTIIRGANGIAGMMGFLPGAETGKNRRELLRPDTCVPYVAASISAIITLLNPGTLVLTGNLLDERVLEQVKQQCANNIPAVYLPRFCLLESLDGYYREGMYQLAVDQKQF